MSTLSAEKVLRINCPGFGVSSILPLGEAKPLAMYDVIVVNPSSILHLYDDKSDILRQIETLQVDGMTSYRAEDNSVIESFTAEFDLRTQELEQFLKTGGLLVFFLAPPFTIQGTSLTMDNFHWLGNWAPDKPTEPNQRNMSATIRGKAIETTSECASTVWLPYLKQSGLEWSTIIRLDNLTDGFVPLATAGPNKCIAAYKPSGPKAGQVVFLPAPYDKAYDDQLKECLDRWYAIHNGEEPAPQPSVLTSLSEGLSSLLSEGTAGVEASASAGFTTPAPSPLKAAENATGPIVAESPLQAFESKPEPIVEAAPEPQLAAAQAWDGAANMVSSEAPKFFEDRSNNGGASATEAQGDAPAKDLIRKMGQELKPNVPDWCAEFSFAELDGLRKELADVNEDMRLAQIKAQDLGLRIEIMNDLKNALLSADGESLTQACTRVFEALGWQVKPALGTPEELWLMEDDKTQAIVRLIYATTQPNRSELAALAESVITYWGAHEVEPKGVLVASTYADRPMSERPDEDFGEAMNEFAKRKNLSLLTTAQLLSVFRDISIKGSSPKEIRNLILTTSGTVEGCTFECASQAKGEVKDKAAAVK